MESETVTKRACRQFDYRIGQVDVNVKVFELLDPDFGLYVWPSALVLAEYISSRIDLFNGTPNSPKRILELGAGTALPSILLAKATTDTFVIITDRPDVPQILDNVQESLKENGIASFYPHEPNARVEIRGLSWGDFTYKDDENNGGLLQLLDDLCLQIPHINSDKHIDIILGSDVFYNPQDFESLLATVSYIINQHNPDCVFLTTYQNRSAKRNIDHLLRKWGLEGREIHWEDFDFDMSKYIGDDEGDYSEDGNEEDGMISDGDNESEDYSGESSDGSEDKIDWDFSNVLQREKGTQSPGDRLSNVKAPKAPLVDYGSSSEEEEKEIMETIDTRNNEFGINQKGNNGKGHSNDKMRYKIGDGGTLSSVHLLWICKVGYENRFWRWKNKK